MLTSKDLINPNINLASSGKYSGQIEIAVTILNEAFNSKTITKQILDRYVNQYRSLNNAFEVLQKNGVTCEELNVPYPTKKQSNSTVSTHTFSSSMWQSPYNTNSIPIETKKTKSNEDLLIECFPLREREELELLSHEQYERIKNMDVNHLGNILYYRRFLPDPPNTYNQFFGDKSPKFPYTSDMEREVPSNRRWELGKYNNYLPDLNKINALTEIKPYTTSLIIPQDCKLLIVIGYHHLEKLWGNIFQVLFKERVQHDKNKIEFLNIQNHDSLTGDPSPQSEKELAKKVKEGNFTHIIDIHEQMNNSAVNYSSYTNKPKFTYDSSGKAYDKTLDEDVPLWAIEAFYVNDVPIVTPVLNAVMNDYIQKLEYLTKTMEPIPSSSYKPKY